MKRQMVIMVFALFIGTLAAPPMGALAIDLDLKGSLGEGKHKRYVPPVSNPFFNENPYITTEVRPYYLNNTIPAEFLTGGGQIQAWAAQIRIALTDRLGIIATKDGYVNADFRNALLDTEGAENIAFGLKYALLSDPARDRILSLGIKFEVPTGSVGTSGLSLQGGGSGFTDVFMSAAGTVPTMWNKIGLQGSFGFNLANNGAHDSSMVHYAFHADYELPFNIFPLVEINGFSTINDGSRTAGVNFEGIDLVNFGSVRSGHVATLNAGARYKISKNIQIGGGYEFPITNRRDLMKYRINADLVISFN
ncbi:MAG: hypothetical protein ACE5GQ_05375 [Nitrospinales bacterium]